MTVRPKAFIAPYRKAGDICPTCHAPYVEWTLTEPHLLDGTTIPYHDDIECLYCDCGKPKPKTEQLSLFGAPV